MFAGIIIGTEIHYYQNAHIAAYYNWLAAKDLEEWGAKRR